MNTIGIMQGRLSSAPAGRPQHFPRDWAGELARAARAGFTSIEWLVTAASVDHNPALSVDGGAEVLRLSARHGVSVTSMCADCFIHWPLVNAAEASTRFDLLDRLIAGAHRIGADVLVLPFLESNAFASMADAVGVLRWMAPVLDRAAAAGVGVAIESDWPAEHLHVLLDVAAHPALGVCYDTGNAAASGFDLESEIRALGTRLTAVHIKDRRHGGGSVPLGSGDVDFDAVAVALVDIGFTGRLIMETPAGADPIASATANRAFLEARLRDCQVSR
jgi:hexulose-6-phosphate isomerase